MHEAVVGRVEAKKLLSRPLSQNIYNIIRFSRVFFFFFMIILCILKVYTYMNNLIYTSILHQNLKILSFDSFPSNFYDKF